jgi:protein required for attachment to host cells
MVSKKLVTWVLVADDKRARIFINQGPKTGLKLIFRKAAGDEHTRVRVKVEETSSLFGLIKTQKKVKRSIKEKIPQSGEFIDWIVKKFKVLIIVSPQEIMDSFVGKLSPEVSGKLHSQLSTDLTRSNENELQHYLDVVMDI